MTKCPRCEQSIDPTTTTICPICGADIQAMNAQIAHDQNAQPQSQEPVIGGHARPQINVRRNLAGEVVPDAPAEEPPSYVIGQAPGSQKSAPPPLKAPSGAAPLPRPAAPQRAPISNHRAETPAKSSNGGLIGLIVVAVLALGGGFWWKTQHRPSPKENAEKFLKSVLSKDYATAYNLIRLTPEDKKTMGSPDDLKKLMQTKKEIPGLGEKSQEEINELANVKLGSFGEPKIDGDKATVSVELQMSIAGQSINQKIDLPLEWDSGEWKVGGSARNLLGSQGGGR